MFLSEQIHFLISEPQFVLIQLVPLSKSLWTAQTAVDPSESHEWLWILVKIYCRQAGGSWHRMGRNHYWQQPFFLIAPSVLNLLSRSSLSEPITHHRKSFFLIKTSYIGGNHSVPHSEQKCDCVHGISHLRLGNMFHLEVGFSNEEQAPAEEAALQAF